MKARVAQVVAPRRMEVVEDELRPPGEGELLIEVRASGICHSDRAAFDGTAPPLADPEGVDPSGRRLPFPYPLGHEPAGVVVDVGPGVRRFRAGDRVAGAGWATTNQSFATHAILQEGFTVPVPAGIRWEHALGEPLGAAVNIVRAARPAVGDRVAVVGCGFMGLLVLSLLVESPLDEVLAVDIRDDRLRIAAELGASTVAASDPADLAVPFARNGRPGFDVVVDVSGRVAGLETALRLAKKSRSRIVASSTYLDAEPFGAGEELMMKAPEILAVHPDFSSDFRLDMEIAMGQLERGRFPMDVLVTHRFGLDEVTFAHETAFDGSNNGYVKGVVLP